MKMTKKAALTGLAALTLAAMVASPTYARRGEDDSREDGSRIGDRGSRYDDDFDDDGIEDAEDSDDDNDGIEDDDDRNDRTATSTAAKAKLKLLKKEGKKVRGDFASSTLDTADLGCLSAAVAEREDALIAALDAFDADAKTALSERKSDLADAYAQTDRKGVKDAVKSAWKTYKDAMKTARGELKDDKKTAYKTFKDEAKACGGSVESTDTSAPGEEILL